MRLRHEKRLQVKIGDRRELQNAGSERHGSWLQGLVVTLTGAALWYVASINIKGEAWDADGYFAYYLGALCLSAIFGYVYPRRSWLWGLILVSAQLVFIVLEAGISGLIVAGIFYSLLLTAPAIVLASIAAHLRRRS
jgi:hypothetical protein